MEQRQRQIEDAAKGSHRPDLVQKAWGTVRFKNANAELFYLSALKRQIWIRIEEEVWRRCRIEDRARRAGKVHYFELPTSEMLRLSKKDERFLKSLRIKG